MKKESLLKNIALAVVVFSVVQIFFDEYGRYALWSVSARILLTYAGFCFDILFTVEFLFKIILAIRGRKAALYWKFEGGWSDFISSFPLLILDLPAVYLLFNPYPGNTNVMLYSILIFIKNMDAVRVLRFLRVIRAFGKIPYGRSEMTKHHIAGISTVVALTVICSFAVSAIIYSSAADHSIFDRSRFYDEAISTAKYLESKSGVAFKDIAVNIFSNETSLLILSYKGEEIISNIPEEEFNVYYGIGDYSIIRNRGFEVYYSVADINREIALNNITYLLITLITVIIIQVVYRRHFFNTVSDVIKKIDSGFRIKQRNEPVIIRTEYAQDEVYRLAKFYNDAYLPAKIKRINKVM